MASPLHLAPLTSCHEAGIDRVLPITGRAKEFETGVEDLSDDDFAADGEVDDSHPGFRSFLRSP